MINRYTGLLVLEVINSNPNGDPDADGAPRIRYDGRGEISPVSFKRKLRDLVEYKDGPVWKCLKENFSLEDEKFAILESRGRDRKQIESELKDGAKIFTEKYWDARLFGNTFLEEGMDKSTIKTGIVQLGMGVSLSPVSTEAQTNTSKAGVEKDKDQGMAPLAYKIVTHGLYVMPFFVNPEYAAKTGCTQKDLDLMFALIPYAYSHNRSAIRPFVEVRQVWVCEHKNPLGSCSDYDIIKALSPKRIAGNINESSSDISDYALAEGLADDLKAKIKECRNLIEEI